MACRRVLRARPDRAGGGRATAVRPGRCRQPRWRHAHRRSLRYPRTAALEGLPAGRRTAPQRRRPHPPCRRRLHRDGPRELATYAPVRLVLGNNDGPDVANWGATPTLEFDLDGLPVAMLHNSGPAAGRPARLL